jgi:hypothetical protein
VFDGVLQSKDTSLALGLVADVGILLTHADHDTLVTRTADDRRVHGTWGIVSSKSSLDHTRPIVYD